MTKTIKILVTFIITFLVGTISVNAGSLSAYASYSTVYTGNSVKITASANGLAGKFSVTSSNGGVLSGGTGSIWIDNGSSEFTFNAVSPGTATVTVRPIDVADYSTGAAFTQSKSVTIRVINKPIVVLSSDNTLSSLGVEGKEITPSFNKDTLEYAVELEPETTKINVTASPSNSGASIAGSGERQVTDGENNLDIVVTAENGSTRTYKIKATVKEYNPITVKIDNKDYTVVRKKSSLTAPNNYKEATVKINNEDVPAFTSEITKYTLVALKDEKGTQNFYIYDAKNKTYKLYKEYKFNNITLYPMELKEIPAGYFKTTITFNNEKVIAYKYDKASDYALIYGMNVETGKINKYTYDSKENTVQIYDKEYLDVINNKVKLYLKILIGLSTCLVISLGTLIFILVKKLLKNKKIKTKDIH